MQLVPHLRERSFEDLGGLRTGDPGLLLHEEPDATDPVRCRLLNVASHLEVTSLRVHASRETASSSQASFARRASAPTSEIARH
jgi:hypothetical protein